MVGITPTYRFKESDLDSVFVEIPGGFNVSIKELLNIARRHGAENMLATIKNFHHLEHDDGVYLANYELEWPRRDRMNK